MQSRGERMLGGLLRASHMISLEDLPALVAESAARAGFSQTMVYVSDLQNQSLLPLPGQYDDTGRPLEPIRIDSTMAGRAFRNIEIVRARTADPPFAAEHPASAQEPRRLWIPLLDGTERVGVLGVTVPEADEGAEPLAGQLADLVSLMLVSKRGTSDSYACLVRADRMSISAEVLWNLMPTMTLANDRIVISAVLEPAYDVGGDAYDYALNGDVLHLAVFDAMGHDISSGLTASIAMGTARNNRRQGKDLLTIGEKIDKAIAEQFDPPRFTTGILASLDTRTGRLSWVNRGHHPPLVLRQGRPVAVLESASSSPMGFGLGVPAELSHYQLEPGDRLVFYTDGVVEARSPGGELFGLERFTDFIIRHEADGLPPPETLRRLIQTILDHHDGRLQDDATVLLVEWNSPSEEQLTPVGRYREQEPA